MLFSKNNKYSLGDIPNNQFHRHSNSSKYHCCDLVSLPMLQLYLSTDICFADDILQRRCHLINAMDKDKQS